MIVQRAIAKTLVFDSADVISLLGKFGVWVSKNVSYKDLYVLWKEQMLKSTDFANDFSKLMLKHGRIVDYNNHRNVIGAIIGGVAAIGSTVASLISGNKQQQAAKELSREQMKTQTDLTIMQMMMQEEANKVALVKQNNMLVMSVFGAMVIVTGLIIYTRGRN